MRLAHRSYGVFHRARPEKSTFGGNGASPVALGKELEKRDRVFVWWAEGIDSQTGTEGLPKGPRLGGGALALVRDARSTRFLESAPIRVICVSDGRGCSCQETFCG